MQMPYIIPVLLFITHQQFLYYLIITIITLIISVCFILFFPTDLVAMIIIGRLFYNGHNTLIQRS